MKKLLLAGVLAIASFPGFAKDKVIPDDAWADTPECQALKRSTGGSNVPIPDNCEVGMADVPEKPPTPVAFKGWQRAWQCNDIRVTETVTQRGIVNYDLGGTIWGGSQFALDIVRGTMWFNGRPCLFLGGTQ
jgi:hypothetical protein